jgi:uncharacterized protein YjcR
LAEDGPERKQAAILAADVVGYVKVLTFTEKALRVKPKHNPVLRYRTASLRLLGHTEEARQSARELLAILPELTVARARAHLKINMNNAIKVPGVVGACCEGLRLAGMPE